ncbi:MFS transporter [Roseibium sp.]|uniref:MFS transporter n=1 Tax=Roseibium sp. TaxID=1936156 RepID=UPI003D144B25
MIQNLSALFVASFLVNLANAAITTLIGILVANEGGTQGEVSLIATAYAAGFAIGCLATPGQASRIGVIRTYAMAAALATITIVGMDIGHSTTSWAVLRFVMGASIAAVLAVSDSWISSTARDGTLGRVIAVYSIVLGFASVVSQLVFLWLGDDADQLTLFFAILMNLSVVVLVGSGVPQPPAPEASPKLLVFSMPSLTAGTAAFVSGFCVAVITSVMPFSLSVYDVPVDRIAAAVLFLYLGRLIFQWPIGLLSDRLDPRLLIALLTIPLIVFCIFDILYGPSEGRRLSGEEGQLMLVVTLTMALLIGAMIFPMYSVSSTLAFSRAEPGSVIRVSTTLLIIYSLGSILGPASIAALSPLVGDYAFSISTLAVNVLLLLIAAFRLHQRTPPEEPSSTLPVPGTSLDMIQAAGEIAEEAAS